MVKSIAVTPSVYVTDQVNVPHYVLVRLRVLVASVSVQLKTPAASLMLYDKAGVANFDGLIVSVSSKHLLMTAMLKSFVAKTEGNSV